MNIEEKISNIFLAFKFAILDYAFSKTEVQKIISNINLLQEIDNQNAEIELNKLIEKRSENGNIFDATKIIIELLNKKSKKIEPDFLRIIKTLDTLCWLNGLEKYKTEQIEEIIDLNEKENFEINHVQIKKIKECLASYEDYDIHNYLTN